MAGGADAPRGIQVDEAARIEEVVLLAELVAVANLQVDEIPARAEALRLEDAHHGHMDRLLVPHPLGEVAVGEEIALLRDHAIHRRVHGVGEDRRCGAAGRVLHAGAERARERAWRDPFRLPRRRR